jgi:hypothetical protein
MDRNAKNGAARLSISVSITKSIYEKLETASTK